MVMRVSQHAPTRFLVKPTRRGNDLMNTSPIKFSRDPHQPTPPLAAKSALLTKYFQRVVLCLTANTPDDDELAGAFNSQLRAWVREPEDASDDPAIFLKAADVIPLLQWSVDGLSARAA
jgi:hypothetical protein